jgi:anti-sigma factor (TIGR02949 family)
MGSLLSKWFGKTEEKRCSERQKCLDILNVVLDGEATTAQKEYLESHIDLCLPCLNDYNLEKVIKELLQSNCTNAQVPPGLLEAVRSKISDKAVE